MNKIYLKLQNMKKVGYTFFKEDSVVIINVEKDFVKKTDKDLKKKFKAEKVSIFKRTEANHMFWVEYGKQFENKAIEEIAKTHKNVSEVKYRDIIKFKFTPYRKNVKMGGGDADSHDYLGELMIKTNSDKTWYNHRYEKNDAEYTEILKIKESLNL